MGHFIRSSKMSAMFSLRGKKKKEKDSRRENIKDSLLDDEAAAVPKGCMAVYVGAEMRRFVIPTSYLRLPLFQVLMESTADEFGFDQVGGLRIPCDEEDFTELLKTTKKMMKS
ncbi:hypothetical protein B296_00012533 [Ensete ventricosum]|nr:hypothetical protein B296_00012533 [Ensete ventricosum]